MVEVVAKLESALASQYTTYSSSSVDDEFVKIFFGQVAYSSSSANSDVDSVRPAVETRSGKSDTVLQVKAGVSVCSTSTNTGTSTATSETSTSLSHDKYDAYEKLVSRMNKPRVVVDNESCNNATVIKVDGTNAHGVLLEHVQVLTDFDLIVTKASRTSDGAWVIDVFNVIDQEGNKVTDKAKIQSLQEVLCSISILPSGKIRKERCIPDDHTRIEFIGNDRPGLLSEVSAILTGLQCNVVSAQVWTHKTRTAAVMHVSDEASKSAAIIEPEKLSKIKKVLSIVLKGGIDNREARITFSNGRARFDRRLHQLMFSDRDYDRGLALNYKQRPKVDVVNWNDNDYLAVSIRCKNTPKVLFDAVCTLTDCLYVVFHGNCDAEGPEAYMEFWIRHIDGYPGISEAERQCVIKYLEAAIERRVTEGLKIEIRTKDRFGLLSDVTRIIRESSLTITRADVTTTDDKAVFSFYLDDNMGYPVDPKIIDYVKNEIGQTILQVKGNYEPRTFISNS